MIYSKNGHSSIRLINAVEHAIGSSPSAVDPGELIAEPDPTRTLDECAGDELDYSGADLLGKPFGDRSRCTPGTTSS